MTRIMFLSDVYFDRIDPRLWAGIEIVAQCRSELSPLPLYITALENGKHSGTSGYDPSRNPPSNSFHYRQPDTLGQLEPARAADLRSHDLHTTDRIELLNRARSALAALSPEYYLILESPGTDNEHYHLQVGHFQ